MKKMERANHIKIESQKSFVQEFNNLIDKINNNIADLGQYEKVEMDKPSVAIAEDLNRLKYHRQKLKMQLAQYEHAPEGVWHEAREEAQQVFDEAYDELHRASDEISAS